MMPDSIMEKLIASPAQKATATYGSNSVPTRRWVFPTAWQAVPKEKGTDHKDRRTENQ
jgi:hypothetical protein